MSSPIEGCPNEILYSILQHLTQTDFLNTCLVSHRLRQVAEPLLYCNIRLVWDASRVPPITQLLRTILDRPEIAIHVKCLDLDGQFILNPPNRRHRFLAKPFIVNDLGKTVEAVEAMKVPYCDDWIEGLRRSSMDAFVALLISQLPSLIRLYLDKNFTYEFRFIGMMLRSSLCEPSSQNSKLPDFRHLRDVSALTFGAETRIYEPEAYRNTLDVLPLFYLPSAQRISVSIDNPNIFKRRNHWDIPSPISIPDALTWPAQHAPEPICIESLDLEMIREGPLGKLLSVTKNLKMLHWNWYHMANGGDQFTTPLINLDQISADLAHVRHTLTDLTITATCEYDEIDYPPLQTHGSLSSIVDFEMLKRLQIPLAFLLGFPSETTRRLGDTLPRNIETLCITEDLSERDENYWGEADVFEAIESWISD
ncbi:hypothetical protein F4810DRAFT_665501 [Camillea tinctor]|nr:hypothetical protein F4810DRAFT_665501 [Camillea tinctor]